MNAPDWVAMLAAARLCRRTSTLKRHRGPAVMTALPNPVAESAIRPLQAGDISEVERLLKGLPPPSDQTLDATAACAALPPDGAPHWNSPARHDPFRQKTPRAASSG